MSVLYHIIIPALIAFFATLWIHPKILKIALMKNLVDNPDARKLQRRPVPVMGGIAVFFGIIVGLCFSQIVFTTPNLFILTAAMIIMLYIGTIDDILDLSPKVRFIVEIVVVGVVMVANKSLLNNFFGLWGIHEIPIYISIPLTIVTGVGIINAINLIDGVNGLSSGFCVMASGLFAIMFYSSGDILMTVLAAAAAGAVIPFFLHNVFGNNTRMFIGDGGTLVMGMLMSLFVINALKSDTQCIRFANEGMGLIPFTLAVLSVPVFDTLRVMSMRIIRGTSPFFPDKTHLHHLFIELGFSHAGTTFTILSLNMLVVICWWLSFITGASVDLQLYIVVILSTMITFVFYKYAKIQIKKQGKALKVLQKTGKLLHIEKQGIWSIVEKIVDRI